MFQTDNEKHFSTSASTDDVNPFHKPREFAPNNLPPFRDKFVGRTEDTNNIIHLLNHSVVKMVHIVGLPGVGKSTLAVRVGYEMASHGCTVLYNEMNKVHIFTSRDESKFADLTANHHHRATRVDSKTAINNIVLPWYSHKKKMFVSTTVKGLTERAKKISNCALLILDNCDSLLRQKQRSSGLLKVFDALSIPSSHLRVVTTSSVKVKSSHGKMYNLKPLGNEPSIKLLQLVAPVMTLNDSRMINEMLDGIPLALKLVGSLVSEERPPNLIIRQLKQNLIGTLTPEDIHLKTQNMGHVLRHSYNCLDNRTQECALYLSHFPGSFSEDAAIHILSSCNNRDPLGCLNNLTHTSLLDTYISYAGQHHYQFHKIIKDFLTNIEFQMNPVTATSMNGQFNSSFVIHFTEAFLTFVNTYTQLPHDETNIGRFENESHNFEFLLEKIYLLDQWTVTSVVNFTHALRSDLMSKKFNMEKLLKVGQKILRTFESRMDEISAQIGANETLNTYSDLVLTLRKWIQSFPKSECKSVCEDTFLQQGYEARLQTIDRQLTMANKRPRDFYRKLYLSFYDKSICLPYCLHFESLDDNMVKINIILIIILSVVRAIKDKWFSVTKCDPQATKQEDGATKQEDGATKQKDGFMQRNRRIIELISLLFCLFATDYSPVISVYIAMLVGIRSSGFYAIEQITPQLLKTILTSVYYVVGLLLLGYATWEHMIDLYFLSICTIVHVIGHFHSNIGVNLLHISTSQFLFHAYFYKYETMHYILAQLVSFVYPYWGSFNGLFLFILFHSINGALIISYYVCVILYT